MPKNYIIKFREVDFPDYVLNYSAFISSLNEVYISERLKILKASTFSDAVESSNSERPLTGSEGYIVA